MSKGYLIKTLNTVKILTLLGIIGAIVYYIATNWHLFFIFLDQNREEFQILTSILIISFFLLIIPAVFIEAGTPTIGLFLYLIPFFMLLFTFFKELSDYKLEFPCFLYDKVEKKCIKSKDNPSTIKISQDDFERPISFYDEYICYAYIYEAFEIEKSIDLECEKNSKEIIININPLELWNMDHTAKNFESSYWNLVIKVYNSEYKLKEIIEKKIKITPTITKETQKI